MAAQRKGALLREGLVFLTCLVVGATALRHDIVYQIHKVEREYHEAQLDKRDSACSTSYSLCPDAVGGGCCPNGYSCLQSYCLATTAGPSSACGRTGWYNCPLSDSPAGACCPVGYICGATDCTPAAATTYTEACPASYYLCPSSLGYGCCQNGMGCAIGGCYSTQPSTYTISAIVTTTDSSGHTTTSVSSGVTVVTPTAASALNTSDPGAIAKLIPSTVSKSPAIETGSSSSGGGGGGLSGGAIGGIVGGAVALLIIIFVIAFFIIRRLNATAKAVEKSQGDKSSGKQNSKPGFSDPAVTEVSENIYNNETLMETPSIRPSRLRAHSQSTMNVSGVGPDSPSPYLDMSSGASTPPSWGGPYNPIPTSDLGDSEHQVSMESSRQGYFDPNAMRYSQQTQSSAPRTSYDSQASHAHSRHPSEASEMEPQHGYSELDGELTQRRRSGNNNTTTTTSRPPAAHVRRNADGRGRAEVPSPTPMVPLTTVNETQELLHGYYGGNGGIVGQTAAPLENQETPAPADEGRGGTQRHVSRYL